MANQVFPLRTHHRSPPLVLIDEPVRPRCAIRGLLMLPISSYRSQCSRRSRPAHEPIPAARTTQTYPVTRILTPTPPSRQLSPTSAPSSGEHYTRPQRKRTCGAPVGELILDSNLPAC
jgi:hypothetical protein